MLAVSGAPQEHVLIATWDNGYCLDCLSLAARFEQTTNKEKLRAAKAQA